MAKTINIVKKPSAPTTLRTIRKGSTVLIPFHEISEGTLRTAVSRLNSSKKECFHFDIHLAEYGTEVTRTE